MKFKTQTIEILGENLVLHPLKALYWPEKKTLLLSDVHVGKVGHFIKNGISIPSFSAKNNYWNLAILFDHFKPEKMVVIGDLTHSAANAEWHEFHDFMDNYPAIKKIVVAGNHDAVHSEAFRQLQFEMHPSLLLPPFTLLHDPPAPSDIQAGAYYISGHLHPGVRLLGKAKTSLVLPCFYFGAQQALLPAFGAFTGYKAIKIKRSDRIFAVTEEAVIDLSANRSTP